MGIRPAGGRGTVAPSKTVRAARATAVVVLRGMRFSFCPRL
ncbi:hypothetical protein [Streptomyces sp. SLBN-118]|nr:hypothetical protein [Streptomyces sp. SLBN-118]